MSLHSQPLPTPSHASSTRVLAAILTDIGAGAYTQQFVDDAQGDDCIIDLGKLPPDLISSKYGLPRHLAAAFIARCHSVSPTVAHHTSHAQSSRQLEVQLWRLEQLVAAFSSLQVRLLKRRVPHPRDNFCAQAAADAAVDGDRVLVPPGRHSGPLHLKCKVCSTTPARHAAPSCIAFTVFVLD